MIKLLPNLVDIVDINKDIQSSIFKKTTYRINIVLGLLFIFLVLIFIYFGINKKDDTYYNNNIVDNNDYINDNDTSDDYNQTDYISPLEYSSNAYELALVS